MVGYIFGVVLYLAIGYILSIVIGLSVELGDGWNIILCMLMWPVVLVFMIPFVIEDVITYLHRKKR